MLHNHQPHGSHRRTARRTASVLACLALLTNACGDEADESVGSAGDPSTTAGVETTAAEDETAPKTTAESGDAAPSPTEPPATTSAPAPVAVTANAAAACDPYLQVSAAMSGAGDPSTVPALLDEIEPVVPAEIDQPLNFIIITARDVIGGGMQDTSQFETPEFGDAVSTVETWMFDNCEFDNRADVRAVDFAYEGVDANYPTGTTAFRVTNDGAEAHEMVLVRRNDGVTETWDDLLMLPEEEATTMVTPFGSAWVGQPGSQETLVADLVPGEYVAVCFIPAGTTVGADGAFTEGSGQPHFMLGMRVEFTVS